MTGQAGLEVSGEPTARPVRPIRIGLLIRSLNVGGAERQVVTLAAGLHELGHSVTVYPFRGGGPLESDLARKAVRVVPLAKAGRWDLLGFGGRLAATLRRDRIEVLYSYLTDPCLMGVAVRPLVPGIRVVWGVRTAALDLTPYSRVTRIAFSLSCFLSRWADLVVANSTAGAAYHVRRGYPRSTMRVVHNGIDTRRFISSPPARRSFREAWGIGSDDLLVGLVARIDPVKGHRYFLRCAASYARANPAARFVCIGSGNSVLSSELRASAEARELAHRLVWVDESLDMPGVYSALDILASCSASEGFSNVLGEAMACGVPCAVTDVGDSRAIVADLGEVVPVGDVEAMVAAWSRLAARRSPALSEDCRRRVEQEYSIERMVTATLDLFVNGAR